MNSFTKGPEKYYRKLEFSHAIEFIETVFFSALLLSCVCLFAFFVIVIFLLCSLTLAALFFSSFFLYRYIRDTLNGMHFICKLMQFRFAPFSFGCNTFIRRKKKVHSSGYLAYLHVTEYEQKKGAHTIITHIEKKQQQQQYYKRHVMIMHF